MNKPIDSKIQKHCFCSTEEIAQKSNPISKTKSKENKNPHIENKTGIKKTLVRNTEKQVPKTRVIKDDLKEQSTKGVQTDSKRRQMCTLKKSASSFEVPKPNTLIQLSKKIECLDKEHKRKERNIAADEKVLKNLNFPYDKPIYKDLIPLVCEKANPSPPFVRSPLPQRDQEPLLSDFVEVKDISKYYILPSVDIEHKILTTRNNNLRLYKILELNS